MEFLRFGSSIPGSYWGCCAVCIIQNMKKDPDEAASIELVGGDGGSPILNNEGKALFAGPTYRDIFWQRLRYGTHLNRDMPNHTFLAVLTKSQINGVVGGKWLALLKEAGFEFIRTLDNSVYTGKELYGEDDKSSHENYLFGLFRNVGAGSIENPFVPPVQWTSLPKTVPEAWEHFSPETLATLPDAQREAQLPLYEALPKGVFFTEDELRAKGVPVWSAGRRSPNPQKLKEMPIKGIKAAVSPFGKAKCKAATSDA